MVGILFFCQTDKMFCNRVGHWFSKLLGKYDVKHPILKMNQMMIQVLRMFFISKRRSVFFSSFLTSPPPLLISFVVHMEKNEGIFLSQKILSSLNVLVTRETLLSNDLKLFYIEEFASLAWWFLLEAFKK